MRATLAALAILFLTSGCSDGSGLRLGLWFDKNDPQQQTPVAASESASERHDVPVPSDPPRSGNPGPSDPEPGDEASETPPGKTLPTCGNTAEFRGYYAPPN